MEDFGIALLLFFFYWMLSGLTSIILGHRFGHFKIRLPKKKIYQTKKEPIYRLVRSDYSADYNVEKWVIDYYPHETFSFLITVIPVPIMFYSFGYVKHPEIFKILEIKHSMDEINKIKDVNLGEFYEKQYNEAHKEHLEYLEKQKNKQKVIDGLNKEFNENFI